VQDVNDFIQRQIDEWTIAEESYSRCRNYWPSAQASLYLHSAAGYYEYAIRCDKISL